MGGADNQGNRRTLRTLILRFCLSAGRKPIVNGDDAGDMAGVVMVGRDEGYVAGGAVVIVSGMLDGSKVVIVSGHTCPGWGYVVVAGLIRVV